MMAMEHWQQQNKELFSRYLEQLGFSLATVRFVTVSFHDPEYTRTQALHELFDTVGLDYTRIHYQWLPYPLRLLALLRYLIRHHASYDCILIHFRAYDSAPFIFFLAWIFGKKVITDHFVSLYDTLCCERKTIAQGGFLSSFLHFFDTFLIKKSDLTRVDTPEHAAYFCQEFFPTTPMQRTTIQYLYVGCDTKRFHPLMLSAKERTIRRDTKEYIVFWYGAVLPLQGVAIILQAIDACPAECNIRFVLGGPIADAFPVWANQPHPQVTLLPWIPYGTLPRVIAQTDLCLGGHFSAIPKATRVVAGKTFQFLSCGKPVLVGDNAANRQLFAEDARVTFVPVEDPQALVQAIVVAYDHACA